MLRADRLICSLIVLFVVSTVAENANAGGLFSRLQCRKKSSSRVCKPTQTCQPAACCTDNCATAPCQPNGCGPNPCCKYQAAAEAAQCYLMHDDDRRRLDRCLRTTRIRYANCKHGSPKCGFTRTASSSTCNNCQGDYGCDEEDYECLEGCGEECECRLLCDYCASYDCSLPEDHEDYDPDCAHFVCNGGDCSEFCISAPAPGDGTVPAPATTVIDALPTP